MPYKGASNAAVDLAAGQIRLMISNYSTLARLIKGGRIRSLAVTSAAARPAFPDMPPMSARARWRAAGVNLGYSVRRASRRRVETVEGDRSRTLNRRRVED